MPCCQKDRSGAWKAVAKPLGVGLSVVLDLVLAGRLQHPAAGAEAGVRYAVRMKVLPHAITPQNRLILCRAEPRDNPSATSPDSAHQRLLAAYRRAHPSRPTPHNHEPLPVRDRPPSRSSSVLRTCAFG
eukprot:EG_transcript_46385